ncbi:Transcriptional regulatory protein UhpA [Corynebacterium ciconiae DSM 44920]|uniref:response regulator transcription factor n=1 Tax=Corynebacterium ciconiae TaxID=227319 RepID=UPI000371C780|nr:response regulator transcription factor [Corynebacterium ciconiae]WKD62090.1 Transcriptional regulatory protein UhpA [Corynebacterium ciconiae DSM 44920]
MTHTSSISVAIADDETLIATSLATLLSLEPDLEVHSTCFSAEELLNWVRVHPVDVCVVDLHMPGIDGIAATEELTGLGLAVLIVTSHSQPKGLRQALAAGASGFLPKTATAEEFGAAIRAVHAGRRYIDSSVAAAAFDAAPNPLSAREQQLLELVPEGSSVDQLAAAVHLAPGTVRNYLSSAIAKTGGANRFEAYKLAADKGWV